MREPKFKDGDVLRVKDPSRFVSSFAKKIADRDAVLISSITWPSDTYGGRKFSGRIVVEFQKRNGRGQVFREQMNESDFVLARDDK